MEREEHSTQEKASGSGSTKRGAGYNAKEMDTICRYGQRSKGIHLLESDLITLPQSFCQSSLLPLPYMPSSLLPASPFLECPFCSVSLSTPCLAQGDLLWSSLCLLSMITHHT